MNDKPKYFPILIDLSRFNALVVGGGKVATRKVGNLLDFGGRVTVIAPEISDKLKLLASQGEIEIHEREYRAGDADAYNLIFSAADNLEVNKLLRADCARLGVLLNAADVPEDCNFIMPATITRGDLSISIGSQGKAPFFVKHMRKHLERRLSPFLTETTELAASFRDRMLQSGAYQNDDIRYRMIHKFNHTDWEKILYKSGKDGALKQLDEIIESKGK